MAGERVGRPMDICTSLEAMLEGQEPSPQAIADALLSEAVHLDDNRPGDDISVMVLKVLKRRGDDVRRMTVRGMRVMRGFLVVALIVVLGSFAMMMRGVVVVLSRGAVMSML